MPRLGRDLNGAEVAAHTFWRAGLILAPFAVGELFTRSRRPIRASLILAQLVCVLGGSVVAFAIWNSALRALANQPRLSVQQFDSDQFRRLGLFLARRTTGAHLLARDDSHGAGVALGQAGV